MFFNVFEVISRNAVEHLASEEHWKRVKGFMWKYGGGMDRVDSFRITEVDRAKVHSEDCFFGIVDMCLICLFMNQYI